MIASLLKSLIFLVYIYQGYAFKLTSSRFGMRLASSMLAKSNENHTKLDELTSGVDNDVRNVVIIGSGPAGCTAAIYAGRAMLDPLVIAGYLPGGQLMLTNDVENFPGYPNGITGPELMDDLINQAKRFGAEFWNTDCISIDTTSRPFRVNLPNGTVSARTVIISTGAQALWLGANREEEFKGRGLSTCATCDAYMFRDKEVLVVGGGDSAMEEASFLTRFAKSVTVVHRRDRFKASKVMLDRVMNNDKIKMLTNKYIHSWEGEMGVLSGAVLKDTNTGEEELIACDGAFIAVGHKPNVAFLGDQIDLDKQTYIEMKDKSTMTNVPGIFACGDVADHAYRYVEIYVCYYYLLLFSVLFISI